MHTFQVQVTVSVTVPGIGPLQFEQWVPVKTNIPVGAETATTPARPGITVARSGPKCAAQAITFGGNRLQVPACVAATLRQIAEGHRRIRVRLEHFRRLAELLPDVASGLTRDPDRKAINKAHEYQVAEELSARVRFE